MMPHSRVLTSARHSAEVSEASVELKPSNHALDIILARPPDLTESVNKFLANPRYGPLGP